MTEQGTSQSMQQSAPRTSVSAALLTQSTFTREQVAWLMAQAMRWGYENREAEENAAYPPEPVFTLGKWFDQATERARAEAGAKLRRPVAYRGGPVPVWGDDEQAELESAA